MEKPLLRWTIGDCGGDGLDVFSESLRRTKIALSDCFDYLICSNASSCRNAIDRLASMNNIYVQYMSWNDYPLDPSTCPVNPVHRQGSFWKICPPRLKMHVHEIIIDNDIIINKMPPQFIEFLSGDRPMISMEECEPYGKYYKFIKGTKSYNSGIIGLPPGFDFKSRLVDTWQRLGNYSPLFSWDEQGLIAVTLTQFPFISIPPDVILPLLKGGRLDLPVYKYVNEDGVYSKRFLSQSYQPYRFSYNEYGYHFCEINRIPIPQYPVHIPWQDYRTGLFL